MSLRTTRNSRTLPTALGVVTAMVTFAPTRSRLRKSRVSETLPFADVVNVCGRGQPLLRPLQLTMTVAPAGASVTAIFVSFEDFAPYRALNATVALTRPATSAKGSVSLTRLLRRRLRVGAKVTIAVTTPNAVGKVRELRVVRDDIRARTLCLAPGAVTPKRC